MVSDIQLKGEEDAMAENGPSEVVRAGARGGKISCALKSSALHIVKIL
jgi:hypothetical protein